MFAKLHSPFTGVDAASDIARFSAKRAAAVVS